MLSYSLRPIDDSHFEVIANDGRDETVYEITRSSKGFCVRPGPLWMDTAQQWLEPEIAECFAPYGP